MKYLHTFCIAGLCCFLSSTMTKAQQPDMQSTLKYVNNVLGSSFEVTVERGYLNVKYFESGELFREDNAACKDLDPKKTGYDPSSKVFSVNCITGTDCVVRVYHIRQIRRDYGRISFAAELSPEEVTGLKKAFEHMIRMVNDTKYKETIDLP